MEVILSVVLSIFFAYIVKKLESLEAKVDRMQEEVLFINLNMKKRHSDT